MPDPETKGTAVSGSEPEDKGASSGIPPAGTDVELDENGKPLPFDQHPKWKSARMAEKKLQQILEANDLSDIDDLVELVNSGKIVKGKLGDLELLDEIIEKALTLEKYEAYWNEQENLKRKQGENPEDTIKRLEQELKEKDRKVKQIEESDEEIKQAKEAIKFYETEVSDLLGNVDNISKDQMPFLKEFLGIDNLSNEIDITDRRAIKGLVAGGIRKFEALKQQIIKDYRDGKETIPKIGSAGTGAEPEKPKIMLKDARKALREAFGGSG